MHTSIISLHKVTPYNSSSYLVPTLINNMHSAYTLRIFRIRLEMKNFEKEFNFKINYYCFIITVQIRVANKINGTYVKIS